MNQSVHLMSPKDCQSILMMNVVHTKPLSSLNLTGTYESD